MIKLKNKPIDIQSKIKETTNEIFKNDDLNTLSSYQKRQMIFNHLCNNISYDYELLDKIKDFEFNKTRIRRDPVQELNSVIINNKGICNAISQYYKLLLEQVGIKSHCVICDDGTTVNHQLNLVYDPSNNTYSFDDVTSVIVNRGTADDFFDYDVNFAKSVNQGNKDIMDNQNFVILPEDYINFLVGRESSLTDTLEVLPTNIFSVKSCLEQNVTS